MWPALIIAYLIGSIPFGLILTRLSGGGDIRQQGSGNIGATNVLRSGNKKLAALTLALDMAKGVAAVIIAQAIGAALGGTVFGLLLSAIAAVLGHIFPIWLKFRGGKGVATALGTLLALQLPLGLCVIGIWLLVFAATRISSLAALSAFVLATLTSSYLYSTVITGYMVVMTLVLVFTHRSNIRRLIRREEPRFDRI